MKVRLHKDLELYYEELGEGPLTLLFLHGLGTNGQCWKKLLPPLSAHYKCIVPDLPGYGQSSQKDYPFSIRFFRETLFHFIEKLALQNVILVGHSMGGHIALSMALEHTASFKGLILMAPAGFETFTQEGIELIEQWYTSEILLELTPQQVRRNFEANFFGNPPELEEMISDRLQMMETPAYHYFAKMIPQCVRGMLHEPVFDRLHTIEIPVLTFFGLDDKLIPSPLLKRQTTTMRIAEEAIHQFPKGKLELIPNCGHFIPLDCHGVVTDKSLSFLQTIAD